MGFLAYTFRRLIEMVPVLIGITLAAFLLLRVMPGDPATLILGTRGDEKDIAALQAQLGLDRPLWEQYFRFVLDVVRGSFGQSIAYGRPVAELILQRLPASLWLVAYSTVLAIVMAVPAAILAALRRGGAVDLMLRGLLVFALATPSFWLGILLILALGLKLGLFPVSGYGEGFGSHLWHLFLPSLVIALTTAAIVMRNLRSSLLAVLNADFIDSARAKGLSSRRVLLRHVLPNALISAVSVLGVHTSWIIGGTVVIEAVFGVPGLGNLLIASIFGRDYPLVQGLTVAFAILVVLVNLATDLAYAAIDPRVSLD